MPKDGKNAFYRNLNLSDGDWKILKWLREHKQELIQGISKKGGKKNDKMEN